MKSLFKRAKYVLTGDKGSSNLEIIIWFSVVLVISTALFLFKDKVVEFIKNATTEVENLKVSG